MPASSSPMDKTLATVRAKQLREQADGLDQQAQGEVDQATINAGKDVPGQPGSARKWKGYTSPEDQKQFENYTKKVSDQKRIQAATLRQQANMLEKNGSTDLPKDN